MKKYGRQKYPKLFVKILVKSYNKNRNERKNEKNPVYYTYFGHAIGLMQFTQIKHHP
jgi:hypothetical protein